MSQFNIQDPEMRRAFDYLQTQIDKLRMSQPTRGEVVLSGDTSGHGYKIRVADANPTALTIAIEDIGKL